MTHSPGPPMVAVPAHPGRGDQLLFEARQTPGRLVLPVFSSIGHLVGALGHFQPWAVLPLTQVTELAAASGIDRIILDPQVADDAWRWQQHDLTGFTWEASR